MRRSLTLASRNCGLSRLPSAKRSEKIYSIVSLSVKDFKFQITYLWTPTSLSFLYTERVTKRPHQYFLNKMRRLLRTRLGIEERTFLPFTLREQFNLYFNLFHTFHVSLKNLYTVNNGFQGFRVL